MIVYKCKCGKIVMEEYMQAISSVAPTEMVFCLVCSSQYDKTDMSEEDVMEYLL